MRTSVKGACAIAACLVVGANAHASFTWDTWENITMNSSSDLSGQLKMTVSDSSGIQFKFSNEGSISSVISEIYFDGGNTGFNFSSPTITGSSAGPGSAAVVFTTDLHPPNLPGGNTLTPQFTVSFGVDAGNQAPTKGINNGNGSEYLTLSFAAPGVSLQALQDALESQNFRVGLHVIGIDPEGVSDSYVNTYTTPVPEPTTALAGALILLPFGASVVRIIRSNRKKQTPE